MQKNAAFSKKFLLDGELKQMMAYYFVSLYTMETKSKFDNNYNTRQIKRNAKGNNRKYL